MTKFVAEIGSNYYVNGAPSLTRAKDLIKSAAKSGADIVKFQYFKANMLYNEDISPKIVKDLSKMQMSLEWLPELKKVCDENSVELMFSVFHPDHVDLIEPYIQRWKIASWELFEEPFVNPLFPKLAETGLPIIMSTAGATMDEIEWCVEQLVDNGAEIDELTIMHCDPGYPVALDEANLGKLVDLAENFMPARVGYSAHIVNPMVVAASVLYFAETIEVHFDLDDKIGAESGHSFSPKQFAEMVQMARVFNIARNGTPKNISKTIGMYRKNPSDWKRPLNREN